MSPFSWGHPVLSLALLCPEDVLPVFIPTPPALKETRSRSSTFVDICFSLLGLPSSLGVAPHRHPPHSTLGVSLSLVLCKVFSKTQALTLFAVPRVLATSQGKNPQTSPRESAGKRCIRPVHKGSDPENERCGGLGDRSGAGVGGSRAGLRPGAAGAGAGAGCQA